MQTELIFDSVRRGYSELESAGNQQIIDYFADLSPDAMAGHISNIKGIAFEQDVVRRLAQGGIDASVFEATNYPVVDIAIWNDGDIAMEAQIKATDNVSYINATLDAHPDVPIIATSEVANAVEDPNVIDGYLSNEDLTLAVESALSGAEVLSSAVDVSPDAIADSVLETAIDVAVPITPIGFGLGILFGLPF